MKKSLYIKATYSIILLAVFASWVFAFDISFNSNLNTFFPSFDENYSELYFNQWSNNFGGLVFLQWIEILNTAEHMALAGDSETFDCHKIINWLYFNPQRWNSVWPLSTSDLTKLRQMDNSYNDISMSWWLYTDCDGKSDDEVYGQITHNLWAAEYKIVAGVAFQWNSYIQDFDDSLKYFVNSGLAEWKLFDSWWGVAEVIKPLWTVSKFSIAMKKNVNLDELIKSDSISISWLLVWERVVASVDNWNIWINNNNAGTSWHVENDDNILIEVRSANDYNAVTSSVLSIGNRSTTFYVFTKPEDYNWKCELSISEKVRIFSIFELLKDMYNDDPIKEETFLYTLKSMLEDRIDTADECWPYDYLLEITESYILNNMWYEDWTYLAPNCKEYHIDYDQDRQAYFSDDFVVKHFFISTGTIEQYIDDHNPWNNDCNHSSSKNDPDQWNRRVAPNGKVYEIKKITLWYTSDDFIYVKSFDTLNSIRKYIDMNNPKISVWDHKIDEDFKIETYIAPNGKKYKIQKVFVREWNDDIIKYMSYKFINVRYFDSLENIKSFIDQNNTA